MGAGLTPIIGGARSGKSRFAEKLAEQYDRVIFVATAEALDDEMRQRIENHKRNRPAHWHTLEAPRAIVQVWIQCSPCRRQCWGAPTRTRSDG